MSRGALPDPTNFFNFRLSASPNHPHQPAPLDPRHHPHPPMTWLLQPGGSSYRSVVVGCVRTTHARCERAVLLFVYVSRSGPVA
ncbi:unnamed protein product [Plutella xylostella]|uniref:(diamondback moth) hypothetical protein n=1 Tax=Plutella xylostella TaxID=51655 RepID=A0A8S4DX40_PLUXY|nr:unnamed protein product [Plutella xylostella]